MLEAEHYLISCVAKPNELMKYDSNRFCNIHDSSQFSPKSIFTLVPQAQVSMLESPNFFYDKGVALYLFHLRQPASSVSSEQSLAPSHLQSAGMQRPLPQRNCPRSHPVVKQRGEQAPQQDKHIKTDCEIHQELQFTHTPATWRENDNTKNNTKDNTKILRSIYIKKLSILKQTNKKKKQRSIFKYYRTSPTKLVENSNNFSICVLYKQNKNSYKKGENNPSKSQSVYTTETQVAGMYQF